MDQGIVLLDDVTFSKEECGLASKGIIDTGRVHNDSAAFYIYFITVYAVL